jgi:dynein heavy chain 1
VSVVGEKMAQVLAARLEKALKGWNKAFAIIEKKENEEKMESEDDELESVSIDVTIELEIILRNQEISSSPPVPTVRAMLLDKLHEYFSIVCSLPRPKSGRYEVFDTFSIQNSGRSAETFEDVIDRVPDDIVTEAYMSLERHIQEASVFVDQWLAYQTLWDTPVAEVAATVGKDIKQWEELLLEAAAARSTLDASASTAKYGPVFVNYGKVQSQIILKYDSWQKELQSSFSAVLGQRILEAHETVDGAKTKLESTSLDSTSTENIVLGVTFIQEVKQKSSVWAKEIEHLRNAEKLLRKQRHIFHSDWMETSVLKGIFDSLQQILERRVRTMDQQVPLLQARVAAEDKAAAKQLVSLVEDWEKNKPLRGNKTPIEAMEILTKFEIAMNKAHLRKYSRPFHIHPISICF